MKRKRILYFGLLTISIFIASTMYFSYAFFSSINEEHGKLNIVAGTLSYKLESEDLVNNEITVEANTMKRIDVTVKSLNDVNSKYELYYNLDEMVEDFEVKYIVSSESLPNGIIEANGSKKITLKIINRTDNEQVVAFGIMGGLETNELILNQGNSIELLNNTCEYNTGEEFVYDYSGEIIDFTVPCDGEYELEVWGAQGGDSTYETTTYNGGYGGYSKGDIGLFKDEHIYIVVGGTGYDNDNTPGPVTEVIEGGYNGGGDLPVHTCCGGHYPSTGGGATHIAKTSGLLETLVDNKDDVLIVAGGGGGAMAHINYGNYAFHGGHGGGYLGVAGIYGERLTEWDAVNSSQTNGYTFGLGGVNDKSRSTGGGGWYGGIQYGGGSGYIGNTKLINKVMFCYNCATSSAINTLTYATDNKSELAVSEYVKTGNGYAKITYLGD